MNKNITCVVNNAYNELLQSGMEGVVVGCLANNYFITYVQDTTTIPVKVNGVMQYNPEAYVIVDCETQMEFHDYGYFINHSRYLYSMFMNINKWFKC